MMHWPRVVQLAAGLVILALIWFALGVRSEIGMKGMPVSAISVILSLAASAAAAYVTTRCWHWLPAPFIAGIVGAVVGDVGPVGGVLGLMVGAAVTIAVVAESRLTTRCR
jgi:hypothetical protein